MNKRQLLLPLVLIILFSVTPVMSLDPVGGGDVIVREFFSSYYSSFSGITEINLSDSGLTTTGSGTEMNTFGYEFSRNHRTYVNDNYRTVAISTNRIHYDENGFLFYIEFDYELTGLIGIKESSLLSEFEDGKIGGFDEISGFNPNLKSDQRILRNTSGVDGYFFLEQFDNELVIDYISLTNYSMSSEYTYEFLRTDNFELEGETINVNIFRILSHPNSLRGYDHTYTFVDQSKSPYDYGYDNRTYYSSEIYNDTGYYYIENRYIDDVLYSNETRFQEWDPAIFPHVIERISYSPEINFVVEEYSAISSSTTDYTEITNYFLDSKLIEIHYGSQNDDKTTSSSTNLQFVLTYPLMTSIVVYLRKRGGISHR